MRILLLLVRKMFKKYGFNQYLIFAISLFAVDCQFESDCSKPCQGISRIQSVRKPIFKSKEKIYNYSIFKHLIDNIFLPFKK